METRQITQYRVFILALAEMHGNVDESRPVYVFDDIEKLKSFYNSHLTEEPWQDVVDGYQWHKVFKKGSPLEWYNELSPINQPDKDIFRVVSWHDGCFGGVLSEWVDREPCAEMFNIPFNPEPFTPTEQ